MPRRLYFQLQIHLTGYGSMTLMDRNSILQWRTTPAISDPDKVHNQVHNDEKG